MAWAGACSSTVENKSRLTDSFSGAASTTRSASATALLRSVRGSTYAGTSSSGSSSWPFSASFSKLHSVCSWPSVRASRSTSYGRTSWPLRATTSACCGSCFRPKYRYALDKARIVYSNTQEANKLTSYLGRGPPASPFDRGETARRETRVRGSAGRYRPEGVRRSFPLLERLDSRLSAPYCRTFLGDWTGRTVPSISASLRFRSAGVRRYPLRMIRQGIVRATHIDPVKTIARRFS